MAIFLFFSLTLSTYAHDFQIIENGRTYWYNLIYNGNGNNKSAQITYLFTSTRNNQFAFIEVNSEECIAINRNVFWTRIVNFNILQ